MDPRPPGATSPATVTDKPDDLLRPELGWDEAALVVRRASQAWTGGVDPWRSAFSGSLSDE